MRQFDNIIIGAGPAGYMLADLLASRGESVLITERDTPGGTCLNRGCIPTKCLLASADAAASAREAGALGIAVSDVAVDFPAVAARMRKVVSDLVEGVKGRLAGCTVVYGEASVAGPRSIIVDDTEYTASNRLVIATGSVPSRLPIPGAELCITSDDALRLDTLPESMAIIGGGVIGMEFASAFHDLGVKVTVIEFCKEILPPFDAEVGKRLRTSMSRRGIDIVVNARVKSVSTVDGGVAVAYEGKKGEVVVEASAALMAVGRRPALPAGIEKCGAKVSQRGYVEVEPGTFRATSDGVYAIGDANGLSMLAHSAYAQARAVAADDPSLFYSKAVPSVVFSRPEVAQVGATPHSLDAAGRDYRAVKHMFAGNGKACAAGHPEGFVKILVDKDADVVLGVSIIGPHAADLIAEATILVQNGTKASEIASDFIHAHPTLSELFC